MWLLYMSLYVQIEKNKKETLNNIYIKRGNRDTKKQNARVLHMAPMIEDNFCIFHGMNYIVVLKRRTT